MSETNVLSRPIAVVSWTLQTIAAVILAQTLFFKFSGSPESVYIFKTLGMEPWGRYAAGSAELIAVVLLLTPRMAAYGALLTVMVIAGAIGAHLTKLGIAIQPPGQAGDGGLLFGLAVTVCLSGMSIAFIRRRQILPSGLARKFAPSSQA